MNQTLPTIDELASLDFKKRTAVVYGLDSDQASRYLIEIQQQRHRGEVEEGVLALKDSLMHRVLYLEHLKRPGIEQDVEGMLLYNHKDLRSIVYGRDLHGETDGLPLDRTKELLEEVNQKRSAVRDNINHLKELRPETLAENRHTQNEIKTLTARMFKLDGVGRMLGGHAKHLEVPQKDPLELTLRDVSYLNKEGFQGFVEKLKEAGGEGAAKAELLLMEATMWNQAGVASGRQQRVVRDLVKAYAETDPERKTMTSLEALEGTRSDVRKVSIALLPEKEVNHLLGKALIRQEQLGTLSDIEQDIRDDLRDRKLDGIALENLVKFEPKLVRGYIDNYGHQEINHLLAQGSKTTLSENGETIRGMLQDRQAQISDPKAQQVIETFNDADLKEFRGLSQDKVSAKLDTLSDALKVRLGAMAEEILDQNIVPHGVREETLHALIDAGNDASEKMAVEAEVNANQGDQVVQTTSAVEMQAEIPGTADLSEGFNQDQAVEIAALIPKGNRDLIKESLDNVNASGLTMIRDELAKVDRESLGSRERGRVDFANEHIEARLAALQKEAPSKSVASR